MNRTHRLMGIVLALASASFLHAAVSIGNSNVQIGGFFSQGWITASGNNYPFEDKGGTFDFREMGLNVSTTVGAHLRVGAQGFAQRLGNYGEDKVILDWLVADYNFRPEFGIRVGRVKLPMGLYGEALDLDAIRPFVFLPMSIYNPVYRDFNSAFNGAEAYGSIELGHGAGSLDYKAFYGNIPIPLDSGVADSINGTGIFNPSVQSLEFDSSWGFHLVWNTPLSGLKAGVSYLRSLDFVGKGPSAAIPGATVLFKVPTYEYKTYFAEYTKDAWTFAAEYQTIGGETVIVLPVANISSPSERTNWYISAARRLNSRFEVGTYYSSQSNDLPRAGSPSSSNHIHDWAFSVRYDVNEHVAIKAEYHSVDGYMGAINSAKTPNPALKDRTSLFAVKTTLSF